jgi:hypothetical protein
MQQIIDQLDAPRLSEHTVRRLSRRRRHSSSRSEESAHPLKRSAQTDNSVSRQSASAHVHALTQRWMLVRLACVFILTSSTLISPCIPAAQPQRSRSHSRSDKLTSVAAHCLGASSISVVLDRRDQLPLGPHANRVLRHRLVDDLKRHKRRKFEILQADADLGGTLADHADVRCGGKDFEQLLRAPLEMGDLHRDRETILPELDGQVVSGTVGSQDQKREASHIQHLQLRQFPQLGGDPLELVFVELRGDVTTHTQSTRYFEHTASQLSRASCPTSGGTDVSWFFATCMREQWSRSG